MATKVSPLTLRKVRRMPVNQSTAMRIPIASIGRPSDVARNMATTGKPPGTVMVPMLSRIAKPMPSTICPTLRVIPPDWARNMMTIM